jgi:hypothetical protein
VLRYRADNQDHRCTWGTKRCQVDNTKATPHTADAETLPLMWVYTNKFNEDSYFLKAKARLVVRGDL